MIKIYEDRYVRIGAKIAYYRKINFLSQEQLAEKVGVCTSHLSRIERGRYPNGISLATLYAIADNLEVDVKDLL